MMAGMNLYRQEEKGSFDGDGNLVRRRRERGLWRSWSRFRTRTRASASPEAGVRIRSLIAGNPMHAAWTPAGIRSPAVAAASCRGGGRDFDPQRAAASIAERRIVDRACGEHEDQVSLGEEGDGVTRP